MRLTYMRRLSTAATSTATTSESFTGSSGSVGSSNSVALRYSSPLDHLSLLSAPKAVAIAAQPYQTVNGPALSMTFEHDSTLFPFQKLPFVNALVPSLYHHSLFDSFAEYAETPRRQSKSRNVSTNVAPMPDFWKRIGAIGTTYSTLHWNGKTSAAPTALLPHPSCGAVELLPSTHRGGGLCDVKATIHDANFQPLSSMLFTGSKKDNEVGPRRLVTAEELKKEEESMTRHEVFSEAERREILNLSNTKQETKCNPVLISAVKEVGVAISKGQGQVDFIGNSPQRFPEGMGFAALAYLPSPIFPEGDTIVAALPPWSAAAMVSDFANAVWSHTSLSRKVEGDNATTHWFMVSHHASQFGDAILGEPLEIVCAEPKYFPVYSMKPWKHQIGLPLIVNRECLAMRVELRQLNSVVVSGVYYFSR